MIKQALLNEISHYRDILGPIPLDLVRRWMQCDDIEVQGQSAELLSYAPYWERITPAVEENELGDLLLPYFKRCLIENPSSDLADSRYSIARELVSWFSAQQAEKDVFSQTFLLRIKEMLATLYIQSGKEIRNAVIDGFLEHVLEEQRWRPFFKDWKSHSLLRIAYNRAMKWAIKHER